MHTRRLRDPVPFLVVHGGRDDLATVEEAEDLVGVAGEHGELLVVEDGVHNSYNRYLELRPTICNWLLRNLDGERFVHGPLA